MAKSFGKLVEAMPQERQAKIDALTQELVSKIPLQEVRKALNLTQEQVASTLHLNKEEVAKIEVETDLYLSTFKRFIEAMGGTFELVVHLPNGTIPIHDFHHLVAEDI